MAGRRGRKPKGRVSRKVLAARRTAEGFVFSGISGLPKNADLKTANVQVAGLAEFERNLRTMGIVLSGQVLASAILDGAEEFAGGLRSAAHKLDGDLRRSIDTDITASSDPHGAEATGLAGADKTGWYGQIEELGTIHRPPHPWLRPTFDRKKLSVQRVVTRRLAADIRSALG